MSGSGIPVSGMIPITAQRLTTACPATSDVAPAATSCEKRSRARRAIVKPAHAKAAKRAITNSAPTRPSSSPMTAKIMSVCASGR